MTVLWFLLILEVALTQCQQQPSNNDVIISYKNENNNDGSYKYSYETSNGIYVEEEGSLKNPGTEGEAQTARGTYSYTAPDGQVITVNWYADETGFHAEGAHIPSAGTGLTAALKPTPAPRPEDIPAQEYPIEVFPEVAPEFFRG